MACAACGGVAVRSTSGMGTAAVGHDLAASTAAGRNPMTLVAIGSLIVQNAEPCYNSVLQQGST